MNFSNFIKILYTYISNGESIANFTYSILTNIVEKDYFLEKEDQLLSNDASTLNKYFKGKRSINSFKKKVINHLDPAQFEEYLDERLSDDVILDIKKEFEKNSIFVDENDIASSITNIYISIIKNTEVICNINKVNKLDVKLENVNSVLTQNINKNLYENDVLLNKITIPEEYRDKFVCEPKLVDNKVKYVLNPINSEVLKDYPEYLEFYYDISQKNEDELKKIEKMKKIISNSISITKPFECLKPDKIVQRFGDFENPLYEYDNMEIQIMPSNQYMDVSLKMISNDFEYENPSIKLKKYKKKNEIVKYSNKFNKKDFFDLSLNYIPNGQSFVSTVTRDYSTKDVSKFYDFYKFITIQNMKNVILIIKNNENNKVLARISKKEDCDEKKEKEIKYMCNNLINLKKLIKIENFLEIKFKFNFNTFVKNEKTVNMLFSYIMNEKIIYENEDIIELDVNNKVTKKIGDIISENPCNVLRIEFMGVKIDINKGKIKFINTKICDIKNIDEKTILYVKPEKIIIE